MNDIDLGPGAAQVWEFLPRVARLTPDEALRLITAAAALEREGRNVARNTKPLIRVAPHRRAGGRARVGLGNRLCLGRIGCIWRAHRRRYAVQGPEGDPAVAGHRAAGLAGGEAHAVGAGAAGAAARAATVAARAAAVTAGAAAVTAAAAAVAVVAARSTAAAAAGAGGGQHHRPAQGQGSHRQTDSNIEKLPCVHVTLSFGLLVIQQQDRSGWELACKKNKARSA